MLELSVQNNALPVSEINEILAFAVSALGGQSGCIVLNGQNPPASPSGQGLVNLNTILNYGGCVYND
jgi:hypothetical protein